MSECEVANWTVELALDWMSVIYGYALAAPEHLKYWPLHKEAISLLDR